MLRWNYWWVREYPDERNLFITVYKLGNININYNIMYKFREKINIYRI